MTTTTKCPSYLPADLSGLPYIVSNGTRYYYEPTREGKNLLRAQVFGKSHMIIRYPDGSTIETLPAGSVGSREIEDGGVHLEDLAPEVRNKLNPENNEQYSENGDIDDIFSDSQQPASTAESENKSPIVVEEEKES